MLDWESSPLRLRNGSDFVLFDLTESPILSPSPEEDLTTMDSPWYKEFRNNFTPTFRGWNRLLPRLELEFTDQYQGCYQGHWSVNIKSHSQEAISMIYNYLKQLDAFKVTSHMNSACAQNDLKINTYSTTLTGTYDLRVFRMDFERFIRLRLRNAGYLSFEKIFTPQ